MPYASTESEYLFVTGLPITRFLHCPFELRRNAVFGTVESYTGGTSFQSDPVDGYPNRRFMIFFNFSKEGLGTPLSKGPRPVRQGHLQYPNIPCYN